MAMNPRIEEVSDSDSDPSDMDPADFEPTTKSIIQRASIPSTTNTTQSSRAAAAASESPSQADYAAARQRQAQLQAAAREQAKHYSCLYPIYFDASRSRAKGRRVSKHEAVTDPLARSIVDAVQSIGIPAGQIVFEPGKTHPRDWANPGRVRVQLKEKVGSGGGGGTGRDMTGGKVRNRAHLYRLVAAYLRDHPTGEDSPFKLRMAGVPLPKDGVYIKPAIPRGVKMGSILPLHSPALSGGGVNEDFFKDMLKEMQAGGALEGNPMAQMASTMGNMGMSEAGGAAGSMGQVKQQRIRVGRKG